MREELEQRLAEEFWWFRRGLDDGDLGVVSGREAFTGNLFFGFGCECGDGWFDVIRGFCLDVEKVYVEAGLPVDIRIQQVKEKYATLRIYYSCRVDVADRIDEVYDKWERVSAETCELCGKPGKVRDEGFWWVTRCDECYIKQRLI